MTDDVVQAQTRYVLKQLIFTNWVNIAVTSVISIQLWHLQPANKIFYWLAFGYLVFVIRTLTSRQCQRLIEQPAKLKLVRCLIAFSLFLSGTVWSSATILFLHDTSNIQFVLMNVTVAAMASGILPAAAAFTAAYMAFLIPAIGTTIFYYIYVDIPSFALFALIYMIALTGLSLNLKRVITRSITADIKNAELLKAVREAKKEAEEANVGKSQFLAAASHDLRQPLHAIGLLLVSLRRKLEAKKTDSDAMLTLQRIEMSQDGLTQLFNYLLDISRLDSGLIETHIAAIPIKETLASLISEFRPVADAKGIQLTAEWQDVLIESCPIFLNRILRNLISNAIKFTHRGYVHVFTKIENEKLIISVTDSGCGIPDNELENIFKPHYQIRELNSGYVDGVGLGLAVVEKMAHLLNHPLNVTSQVGVGSCFELTMTIAGEMKVDTEQAALPAATIYPQIQGHQVLIVDDNPQVLDALDQMLGEWGCTTTKASSLADIEAMPIAHLKTMSFLICDHQLSDSITSNDIVHYLHSQRLDALKTIIISADTSSSLVNEMQQRNSHLLHKPTKPAHLLKAMRQLLAQE